MEGTHSPRGSLGRMVSGATAASTSKFLNLSVFQLETHSYIGLWFKVEKASLAEGTEFLLSIVSELALGWVFRVPFEHCIRPAGVVCDWILWLWAPSCTCLAVKWDLGSDATLRGILDQEIKHFVRCVIWGEALQAEKANLHLEWVSLPARMNFWPLGWKEHSEVNLPPVTQRVSLRIGAILEAQGWSLFLAFG